MYQNSSATRSSKENNSFLFSKPSSLSTSCNSSLLQNNNLLLQERQHKANQQMSFEIADDHFSNFLCSIFSFSDKKEKSRPLLRSKCHCEKVEDGKCTLILRWIQKKHNWKNEKQFSFVYESYKKEKNPEHVKQIKAKLDTIVSILGICMQQAQIQALAEIMASYVRYTVFNEKSQRLVLRSDIYLWVGLGITYHVGISSDDKSPQIIFWALKTAMDMLKDLSPKAIDWHTEQVMKLLHFYYKKWANFFIHENGINLQEIVYCWVSEMMFGYMGIQSIAFFINCFMKIGWNYLYKVILSFFQQRIEALSKDEEFLNGNFGKQKMKKFFIDGKEEWPLVFCCSMNFNFQDLVLL